MKKLVLFIAIIPLFLLGQDVTSISVKYKPLITINKIDKEKKQADLAEKLMETFTNKTFILKTNSKGFLFEEEATLDSDEKSRSMSEIANIVFSVNNCFYDKKRNQMFTISNNLNMITKHHYDWEMSTETKKIDNYNSYKATTAIKFFTKKGEEVNRIITAWYTPEINVNYGPNGFMGLPGLILELEFDNTKLVAKDIKFFDQEENFEFPKYKEVTEDQFLKMLNKN